MAEIEKIRDCGNARVWYRTTCECMSDDHPLTVELEYDKDFPELTMFFKCVTADYKANQIKIEREDFDTWKETYYGFLNNIYRIWWRIKAAWHILFKGYIELEEAFIFRGKNHIQELGEALLKGVEKVEAEHTENQRLRGIIKDLKEKVKANGQENLS